MFRKKNGSRGAVSVFLVLILVPCLMCSSLFVDAGRVHLSKSVSSSAADLALNSLLTHYDYDLNDFYGMMASCQNISDFYEQSAKYYVRMLESAGLEDDEMKTFVDQFASVIGNDAIYDLLKSEVKSETSTMITPVSNANLSNATIIKDQIVEFMKYRAPISIATGIIDTLKKGGAKDAIEADANEGIVNAKQDFYETDAELTDKSFKTYKKLMQEYTQKQYTSGALQGSINKFNGEYKNLYKEIHTITFEYLHNTSGLTSFSRPTQSLTYYQNTYKKTNTNTYKKTVDGTTKYYIEYQKSATQTGTDIKTAISKTRDAITAFENAINNFNASTSGITYSNDVSRVQYWVQVNNAIKNGNHINNISEKAKTMLQWYSRLVAIKDCELGENITASLASIGCPEEIKNWETTVDGLLIRIKTLQSTYLTQNSYNSNNTYLVIVKRLEGVSSGNASKLHYGSHTLSNGKNIDETLSGIASELTALKTNLTNLVKTLDFVINGQAFIFPSLNDLANIASEYKTDLNTWYNTANTAGTDLGEKDVRNIENSKNQGEDAIEPVDTDISYDNVMELKSRLINIKSQLSSVISAIDNLKYGNKKLTDIKSFSGFYNAFKSGSVPSIPLKTADLKNSANSYFGTLYKESSYTLNTSNDHNIELDPATGDVAIPSLYENLHKKYRGRNLDEVEKKSSDAKDALDSLESTVDTKLNGDGETTGEKDKERHNKNASEITKSFSPQSDADFKLGDGLFSGLIGLISDLVNLDVDKIRDDMYVTTYIMEMFSFATFENEGKYSLVDDKSSLTLTSYPNAYSQVTGNAKTKKTWLSEALTDSYNKTLRNKMINSSNNAAYECEVEYILYGGSNKDNVKAAYADILTVRSVLNLVAGFQHFWSGTNLTATAITSAAGAIATATAGIVPIPLTKCVMITVLATLETINDLALFQAGFPVPLYKSQDTWQVQFPSGVDEDNIASVANANGDNSTSSQEGLQYSDYLTLFVYLGLTSDRTEVAMYQRIAEVIQTNIRNLSGSTGYSMKKAIVYFNFEAKVEVDPLLIKMPIFSDYSSLTNDTSTWCSYTTKITRGYT